METILKDFDDTVEQTHAEISSCGKTMRREIKTFHKVEWMKMPKNIADMKLTQFFVIGGTVIIVQMLENKQIDQMKAIVDSKKGQRLLKKAGNAGPLEAIAEEGQENVGPTEVAKMRTRKTRAGSGGKNPLTALQKNTAAVGYECTDSTTPLLRKPAHSG